LEVALSCLGQALDIRRTLNDAPKRWAVQAAYASALLLAKRLSDADRQLAEIPIDSAELSDEDRLRVLRGLGVLRARQGLLRDAMSFFDRAAAATGTGIEFELERAETLSEAGSVRYSLGDLDGAAASVESALHIFAALQASLTPARADALYHLAQIRVAQNRIKDARSLLQDADAFWQRFEPASPWAHDTALLLAVVR